MADIRTFVDINDDELAVYSRLTEAQLKNRQNIEKGLFVAENHKVISAALDGGYEPVSFLMEKKHIENQGRELIERCPDVPVYTAESTVLEKLTGYRMSRGMLCAMKRPALKSPEEVCKNAKRIAVLENIVDPSNVGAIFRSAAALGLDALLLSPGCCDPLYRKAVRVSMGTVFKLPWAVIGKDSREWAEKGAGLVKTLGFETAALALKENAVSIEEESLKSIPRLALFLGTEGDGLMDSTVSACDRCVIIPMSRGVDSLNVATAAALAFWELRA